MSRQRTMDDSDPFEERTRITFEVPQKSPKSPANLVIVTYYGSQDGFANIQEPFRRDISNELYSWKRTYGQVREVYCHVQFEKYRERTANERTEAASAIDFQGPILHSYWCDCQSVEAYKALGKSQIASWLDQLEAQQIQEWMIIVLVRPDAKRTPRTRPTPRLEVYERICSDFCTKIRDRNRCTFIMDPRSGLGDADAWHTTIGRFRQLIYDAYETKLRAFEEKLRISRENRAKPGWKLSEYISMRETLATAYQRLCFPEEALLHLDEISAIISQFVAEASQNPTNVEYQEQCRVPPKMWIGLNIGSKCRVVELKEVLCQNSGYISLLDLRSFLFVRQFELLVELGRGWELTMRAMPFVQNVTAEAKMFNVSMMPGALDCWTFLTCHEVRKLGLQCGDGVPSTNQQDNATLLGLEREKLGKLGHLCGLTPNLKPTNEQRALTDALSKAMSAPSVSAAVIKLYEALQSAEKFTKTFLELSEMTMGTFKHVGRTRAAKMLGIDLAKFYMDHGSYDKAAGFLLDALKMLRRETWAVPCADIAILYTKNSIQTQQWDQAIKSALLVAACAEMPLAIRREHMKIFIETVSNHDSDRDKVLLSDGLFFVQFVPNSDAVEDCIACNQSHEVTVTLNSILPDVLPVLKCRLILRPINSVPLMCSRSPIPESENFFTDENRVCLRDNRVVCTSTISDGATVESDAVPVAKPFPGIKCVSPNAAARFRSESVELTDSNGNGDLVIENATVELKPGCQKLTFRHKFLEPGVYRIAELHVVYTDTFKMIMIANESYIINVLDVPPVCSVVAQCATGETLWMHTPYEFRLCLTGCPSDFNDVPVLLTVPDRTSITISNHQAVLSRSNQHSLQFQMTCSAKEPDYIAEILVSFPWKDEAERFKFNFASPFTVSTSSHFCAPLSGPHTTLITVAIINRWLSTVSLVGGSLGFGDLQLSSLTDSSKILMLKPGNTLRLIFSSQDAKLHADDSYVFRARYSYVDAVCRTGDQTVHGLSSSFSAGVFGSTRLMVTVRTSHELDSTFGAGETVEMVFVISVLQISSDSFPVFYQIKYDQSFWTSTDETSGSINLLANQNVEISCHVIPVKLGSTILPGLRLFHVKDEDIVPIDAFHVYNESTHRVVTVSPKQNIADIHYVAHAVEADGSY